ncbi:MAG: hypothetical protein RLN80_03840, partial [Rhodospirillales bacterium]
ARRAGNGVAHRLDAVMTRDGVFAGLAGLQTTLAGPLTLALNGSGPLSGWQGNLNLGYGDLLTFDSAIAASLSNAPRLKLDGTTDLRKPAELGLPDLLSGKIRHTVSVQLQDDDRITVDGLNISLPERFTLTGDAGATSDLSDISSTVDLQLDPALAALAGPGIGWDDLFLTAAIAGNPANPEIDIVASVTGLAVDSLLKADAGLSARLTGATDRPYQLDLSTALSDISWADGIPGNLVGQDISLILAATAEPGFSRFTLSRAKVDAGSLSATAKATASAAGDISDSMISLTYADLAGLQGLTGLDLSGRAELGLTDFSGNAGQGFSGKLAFRGQQVRTGIPDLDRLIGDSPTLSSDIAVTGDGSAALNDLTIRAGALSIDGRTAFTASDARIAVDLAGNIAAAGLPSADGLGFPSGPQFDIKMDGPVATPSGTVSVSLASLKLADLPVEKIRLDNRISWTADIPSISVTLTANIARQALAASTVVRAGASDLALDALKVSLPGLSLAGDLALPGYGPAVAGKLRLDIRNGNAITALAGVPLKLSGRADIDLAADKGRQNIAIRSDLADLRLADAAGADSIRLEQVALTARINDALADPRLTADLQTRGISVPGGSIALAKLTAQGGPEALSYGL